MQNNEKNGNALFRAEVRGELCLVCDGLAGLKMCTGVLYNRGSWSDDELPYTVGNRLPRGFLCFGIYISY